GYGWTTICLVPGGNVCPSGNVTSCVEVNSVICGRLGGGGGGGGDNCGKGNDDDSGVGGGGGEDDALVSASSTLVVVVTRTLTLCFSFDECVETVGDEMFSSLSPLLPLSGASDVSGLFNDADEGAQT